MKNPKVIGNQLIEAIAYGDALGLSVETRNRQEILRDLGGVVVIQEMCGHRDFAGEPGGIWSDDAQLSMAVAESLTEKQGFDLGDQAQKLIKYANETPFIERDGVSKPRGWGNSTYNSVKRLEDGYPPDFSGEFDGAGNGVLMKLAPLSFWYAVKKTDAAIQTREITALTRMTHDAPEAVVASLVHNDALQTLLSAKPQMNYEKRQMLVADLRSKAKKYEEVFDPEKRAVSRHLARVVAEGNLTPEKIVKMAPNGGFYAPETLAMVYGSFILEPTFPASVQRTVELGGDTDTTSAIIAPMSLFDAGEVQFPPDAERLEDVGRLRMTARLLTTVALKGVNNGNAS